MTDLTGEPGWPYDTMHFTLKQSGSPEFITVLEGIKELHQSKSRDYGTNADPLANIKGSEAFGLPSWIGVSIRIQDKMFRIQSAVQQYLEFGTVSMSHDSLEDDFKDICSYGAIGVVEVQRWERNHAE